jgi:hypothetical protein
VIGDIGGGDGVVGKGVILQIMNREPGPDGSYEIGEFGFAGVGLGVEFGKLPKVPDILNKVNDLPGSVSAPFPLSNNGFTNFETTRPVMLGDFQGPALIGTAAAGLGLNLGYSTFIPVGGPTIHHDSNVGALLSLLGVGDVGLGAGTTGLDVSLVLGGVHQLSRRFEFAELNHYADPNYRDELGHSIYVGPDGPHAGGPHDHLQWPTPIDGDDHLK